jgi:hypothetical protein
LVHIDLDGGRPDRSSLVALAAGRHVASSWGATLYAAVIIHDPDQRPSGDTAGATTAPIAGLSELERALVRYGSDKIVIALSDAPVSSLWGAVGAAWQGVLEHLRPRLVLFGADSPSATELAPRTGARIGARLLMRARAVGIDDVELRDRDGGYVRASDGGAAVVMIGRAKPPEVSDDDVDRLVLATPGGADPRIEVLDSLATSVANAASLVALGDDVVGDASLVASARRLAELLDAQLVGGAVASRAGVIAKDAIVEATTSLAPELCVTIGGAVFDVAGATSVIQIGATTNKHVDGILGGRADTGIAELVKRLEDA